MGKANPKKVPASEMTTGTMADLIGPSVSVKVSETETIVVPSDKAGNRVANMILAAKIRALIEGSITTYKEKDMLPTPKDLKDLAEAAKSLHAFSGEVYKEDDAPLAQPKKIERGPVEPEVNFDDALDVKTDEKK